MVKQNVNKNREKKLPKTWENKFPKFIYSLLQTLSLVTGESSFWTLNYIVSPIDLISDLSEERVRGILQQPNNLQKKVNNGNKKNLTWLKFIQYLFNLKGKLTVFLLEKVVVNLVSL